MATEFNFTLLISVMPTPLSVLLSLEEVFGRAETTSFLVRAENLSNYRFLLSSAKDVLKALLIINNDTAYLAIILTTVK